jgi:signal recognition particle GTPase
METLFITPELENKNVIFLFDASGSVKSNFIGTDKTVFETMCEKMLSLMEKNKVDQFRTLFWNSDTGGFLNGTIILPFYVQASKLLEIGNNVIKPKINNNCLTYTWLAFDKIPSEWLNHVDPISLYLITDGEIGWGNMTYLDKINCSSKLAASIKKILNHYNNVQINIIAVENVSRNYDNLSEIQSAAGCDVFNIIQQNGLTNSIASFISFGPNHPDGYVQFKNIRTPPGHAPFKQQYFHLTKSDLFYKYIKELIPTLQSKTDAIYDIANELSKTLHHITKDKTPEITKKVIDMYSKLFVDTGIDVVLLKFILTDTIEKDRSGKSEIISQFRERVKNLFKEAENLLYKDTKDSLGTCSEKVVTLPLSISTDPTTLTILSVPAKLMDQKLFDKYNNSSIMIDGKLIPLFPMKFHFSEMSCQCMRQWIRAIISKMTGKHPTDDDVLHIFLSETLRVIKSDVDIEIKKCYQEIAKVMLMKKRTTDNITELEFLQNGNMPSFNNNFDKSMLFVTNYLTLSIRPYTMWYALCLAIGDESLINNQIIHCHEHIKADFPNIEKFEQLLDYIHITKKIEVINIPNEYSYEYKCIITLDDTSQTGGFMILSHYNQTGDYQCSPNQVLSKEGYELFIKNENSLCPICYQKLTHINLVPIDKKPEINIKLLPCTQGTYNIYTKKEEIQTITPKKEQQRFLILMRGTIGAGKSTIAKQLHKKITDVGIKSIIISMDQYCKEGYDMSQAANNIKNDIIEFSKNDDSRLVIISDLCNEKNPNLKNYFGINMMSWKPISFWANIHKVLKLMTVEEKYNYLAWSLYNVLNREIHNKDSLYFLNPVHFGFGKCIEIHKRKYETLLNLGKNKMDLFDHTPKDLIEAKSILLPRYNQYNEYLKQYNIDDVITTFLDKNKIII